MDRLRDAVQAGDEDRFQRAMDWVRENRQRPRMPSKMERKLEDGPKGDPIFEVWICPGCGTEQAGPECVYCRRGGDG